MKKIAMTLACASVLPIAFDNGAPKTPEAPKAKTDNAAKPKLEITVVSSAVPMPERTSKRGSTSQFPFDQLTTPGMSFGVKDRTAASMSSIVSAQNRKHVQKKTDGAGNIVFKQKDVGNGVMAPTSEPETVVTKHFFSVDTDKKTDPDGASVRIFRDI